MRPPHKTWSQHWLCQPAYLEKQCIGQLIPTVTHIHASLIFAALAMDWLGTGRGDQSAEKYKGGSLLLLHLILNLIKLGLWLSLQTDHFEANHSSKQISLANTLQPSPMQPKS